MRARKQTHLKDLRKNQHGNGKLQNHYNKYGEADFLFNILIACEIEELIIYEQFFFDSLNPWFNICKKAGSVKGLKHSFESKQKVSQKHKGKIPWNKGKIGIVKRTEEQKQKLKGRTPWMKGKHHKEESNYKNSQNNLGRIPWNKGKKGIYSIEALQKMSEAKIGKPAPFKGRIHTKEAKLKMSIVHKGKPGYWTGKKRTHIIKESNSPENNILNELRKAI